MLRPEDVWLKAADGTKLHAWWIPSANAEFTFLAFHGNASNIANSVPAYEFLQGTPAYVLALEYRGYGHSEGKPSEAGLYLDAEAAYPHLVGTKEPEPVFEARLNQNLDLKATFKTDKIMPTAGAPPNRSAAGN
jgi:hypothetical protein